MYSEVEIDRLMNLESAIFVCFGDTDIPMVESDEDALIDAVIEYESCTRAEASAQLHGQK